jgi:sensor domain CHASE-containing protein
MLVYVIIIVATLTVLKRDKPSVIQLSILVGINVLFVLSMFRTENRLRMKARRGLRKVLQEATNTHSKLAFQLKQQDRGRKQIFYYIEVSIEMPIALSGAWETDDGDDGDVTVNLASMVQSA